MRCAWPLSRSGKPAISYRQWRTVCPRMSKRRTRRYNRTGWIPMINWPREQNMNLETLREHAAALRLNGLLAHWPEVATADWLAPLLQWEEAERSRRSQRRLASARIGRFKPLVDFDWDWPSRCDRAAIEALMALEFIAEAANVVLVGLNGVGKSTLARNIAHQALIQGLTVRFATAGDLLGELAALDSAGACATTPARTCWS